MKQTVRIAIVTAVIALVVMGIVFGIVFGVFYTATDNTITVPQPNTYYIKAGMDVEEAQDLIRGGEGVLIPLDSNSYRSLLIYDRLIIVGDYSADFFDDKLYPIHSDGAVPRGVHFPDYEVRYDLDGGTCVALGADEMDVFSFGYKLSNDASSTIKLLPMVKEGYIFTGWELTIPKDEDFVMVFTAKFQAA